MSDELHDLNKTLQDANDYARYICERLDILITVIASAALVANSPSDSNDANHALLTLQAQLRHSA